MKCPLCGHEKPDKHGLASKGAKRYFCPKCRQTFTETFDTLYYRHQVSEEEVRIVLQSHAEGSALKLVAKLARWLRICFNTGLRMVTARVAHPVLVNKNLEIGSRSAS